MYVLRNFTVENLFPETTRFSGYGDVACVPADESLIVWFYQVPIDINSRNFVEWIRTQSGKLAYVLNNLVDGQRLIICSLMNLFPIEIESMNMELNNEIFSFNSYSAALAEEHSEVAFVDVQPYFARYPEDEWINWRFYFISQMIVALSVAAGFYDWFSVKLQRIEIQRKKCLVFNLDNTIWSGILGEDGAHGVKMDGDYPGNAFAYFQNGLIELSKDGIILAVCSKNNEEDVMEVWNNNPYLKLNPDYISAYRINWRNKADNIRQIAQELNIGLDSIVFIDDNPSERELVRTELPMVEVPDFPKRAYNLMKFYKELVDNYFGACKLTPEDTLKTAQYAANRMRTAELNRFADLDEFIKSLDIHLIIEPVNNYNISRLAQLANKTNQFNLTTQRYTAADLQQFANQGHKVLGLSVQDRFGDYGITGLAIVKLNGPEADIDTLLLSCRILGKGIEDAFFSAIVNILHSEWIFKLKAKYIPTLKNKLAADFYSHNGMTLMEKTAEGKRFMLVINEPFSVSSSYKITCK